jgi:hypothetical protein
MCNLLRDNINWSRIVSATRPAPVIIQTASTEAFYFGDPPEQGFFCRVFYR